MDKDNVFFTIYNTELLSKFMVITVNAILIFDYQHNINFILDYSYNKHIPSENLIPTKTYYLHHCLLRI